MPIEEAEKDRIMDKCLETMSNWWLIGDKCYKRMSVLGKGAWAIAFCAKRVDGCNEAQLVSSASSNQSLKSQTKVVPGVSLTREPLTAELIAVKAIVKGAHSQRSLDKYPRREVNIMRKLTTHPNVVKMFAHWQDDQCFYLAMELCPNRSLSTLVKTKDRLFVLSDQQIKRHLIEMLLGCQYIHQHLVVHRDLKPDNVLLDADSRIKISDFGLSVELQCTTELLHSICGTPKYQAPEIIRKLGYSFPVDVWAVGCIIYRLYYKVPPYDGPDSNAINEKVLSCHVDYPRLDRFQRVMDQNQLRVIRSMLKKNPQLRASIESLLGDPFLQLDRVLNRTTKLEHMLHCLEQIGKLKTFKPSPRANYYVRNHEPALIPSFWVHHSIVEKHTGLAYYQYNNPNLYGCTFRDGSRMLYVNYRTLVYRGVGDDQLMCIDLKDPNVPEELKTKGKLFHRKSHHLSSRRYPKKDGRLFDGPVALDLAHLDRLTWLEGHNRMSGIRRNLSAQCYHIKLAAKHHLFQIGQMVDSCADDVRTNRTTPKCFLLDSETNSITVLRHNDQMCSLPLAFILADNCTPQMHKFVLYSAKHINQLLHTG